MLSKKSHRAIPIWIHLVHERVSILAQRSCEDHELVVLRHYFQKVVHTRSFLHKDVADIAVDIHGDYVIGVFDLVKLTVH